MNPKAKGEISEGAILAAFLKAGKTVLLPFGDNQRYDLVIDEDGIFKRLQCKTGQLIGGRIVFKTCSSQAHRGKGRQDYRGQIDAFAVYCPKLDKIYIVPIDETGTSTCSLRHLTSKNNQAKGVKFAKTYEF